eukprot:COSAG06_NODE_15173_length_1092_cov_1.165156_2_plen_205_part_00
MTYGGEGLFRAAALMDGDEDIFRPAGLGGDGWWDDAVKETKRVAKRVQKSSAVRGLEKRALRAGADVLRGAATAATDGLADSALSSLGAPELAPLADKLISKGAMQDRTATDPAMRGRHAARASSALTCCRKNLRDRSSNRTLSSPVVSLEHAFSRSAVFIALYACTGCRMLPGTNGGSSYLRNSRARSSALTLAETRETRTSF